MFLISTVHLFFHNLNAILVDGRQRLKKKKSHISVKIVKIRAYARILITEMREMKLFSVMVIMRSFCVAARKVGNIWVQRGLLVAVCT